MYAFSTFGNANFINKDFGVSASDAQTSGLEETDLSGGYRSTGIQGVYRHIFNEHVQLIASSGVEFYSSAISDSPIARQEPERMREIGYRDQQYLRAIEECNHKALFDHIAEDQDARRVCGFPTMYLVLDVLNRLGGETDVDVVAYDQAVDYPSDCAVTFAGVRCITVPVHKPPPSRSLCHKHENGVVPIMTAVRH